jgi:hypothetical protein
MQETNFGKLEDFTPEMIAHTIFLTDASDPLSYQILTIKEDTDLIYVFEILLTILLEGLEIVTRGLKNIDLSGFNDMNIRFLKPWFESIGFDIRISIDDISDKELYQEYYCKIMINNGLQKTFFEMKGLDKPYHFLLNGTYLEKNKQKRNLNEVFAIFLNGDKAYSISFNFHIPDNPIGPVYKAI